MVITTLVHAGVAMRTPDRGLAARTKLRAGPELLMIALGALAFAVDALRVQSSLPPVPGEDRRIEVPAADALRQTPLALADDAVGQRGGEAETARWIRAEVLYREALRLGLDEGDVIVRRRLVQKMEYLLEGMSAVPEFSPAEVERYFHTHAERYRQTQAYTFTHRFFSSERGIDAATARAREALSQLRDGTALAETLGDPYTDGNRHGQMPAARVLQRFGEAFLQGLDRAPAGEWSEPLRSRHGIHLVRRERTHPSRLPPLDEVRATVVRDLVDELRRRQVEQRYGEIEARYEIARR